MNTANKTYDVIIVGAGPAGSTAAFYAAKNPDLAILIIDRYDFPRHKSCGGGLNRSRDWHLEFENFVQIRDQLQDIHPNQNFHVYWNKKFLLKKNGTHLFDKINRYEFDHKLLEAATSLPNVEFKKFQAQDIKQEGNLLAISNSQGQKIFSRCLIGADGCSSVVAKHLGNPARSLKDTMVCLEHDIKCKKSHDNTLVFLDYEGELGYTWIFTSAKGYNVGAGFWVGAHQPLQEYLNRFISFCQRKNFLPQEYKVVKTFGGPIPITVPKNFATDQALLCGDALGLVMQKTGEGIYFAMKSGKVAGELIAKDFNNLAERYKIAIRPSIDEITSFKKIPPKWLMKTSISILATLSIIGKPFGWQKKIYTHALNKVLRRYNLPKNSYYTKF